MKSNNINIFINSVCDNIKYSYIKDELRKELYEHIIEEKNSYIEDGIESEEAEQKAIKNMGKPEDISRDFNKIYKRKIDWKTLIIFLFLILVNILLILTVANSKQDSKEYLIRNGIYVILGGILSFIVYFIDYKKIEKFSLRNRNSRNFMHNS